MTFNKDLYRRVLAMDSDFSELAKALPAIIDQAREEMGEPGTDDIRRHPAVSLAAKRLELLCGVKDGTVLLDALAACELRVGERMYEDANAVQNACNPSGVSRSFARYVELIEDDGEDLATHPVARAFASKLADLCWSEDPESECLRRLTEVL